MKIGADGNIKGNDGGANDGSGEASAGGGGGAGGKQVHDVMMTDEGRVAMMHVAGVQYDFDQIPTKPQFRPALLSSGSTTRSELLLRRRGEKYPDLSMDLDGDGALDEQELPGRDVARSDGVAPQGLGVGDAEGEPGRRGGEGRERGRVRFVVVVAGGGARRSSSSSGCGRSRRR